MTNEDVMYELLSKFRVYYYSTMIPEDYGYLDFKYRTNPLAKKFDFVEVAWNEWVNCESKRYPHPVHNWMLIVGIESKYWRPFRVGYANTLIAICRIHDPDHPEKVAEIVDWIVSGGASYNQHLQFLKPNGTWQILFKYPEDEQKQCITLTDNLGATEPVTTCHPSP